MQIDQSRFHATAKLWPLFTTPDPTKASLALWKVDKQKDVTIPLLIDALKHKEKFLRKDAASALGEIGPEARAGASQLKIALQDPDESVRVDAALALWRLERNKTDVLPTLLKALKNNDRLTVFSATQALADMGPEAKEATEPLIRMTKKGNFYRREEAAKALKKIDPQSAARMGIE